MDSPYPRPIRAIAACLTVLGVWYALFGAYVLANLPSVTHDWIAASGDPDFRFDFDIFAGYAGIFSAILILFGGLTAAFSAGLLARREWASSPAWLGLTLLAVLVHLVRLPIQRIDDTLTKPLVGWFVIVCVAYLAVWISVRRRLDTRWSGEFHEPTDPTNPTNLANPTHLTNPTNPTLAR